MLPAKLIAMSVPEATTPAPINPKWIVRGNPCATFSYIHRSDDGLANVVSWRCSPGEFDWHYDHDEILHVISGKALLNAGTPEEREVGAGDVVVFFAGTVVRWKVIEEFYKLAIVRRTLPKAMVPALDMVRRLRHGKAASGFGGFQTEQRFAHAVSDRS